MDKTRAKRRSIQREAFLAYLKRTKSVQETWTGWKKELVTGKNVGNVPKNNKGNG